MAKHSTPQNNDSRPRFELAPVVKASVIIIAGLAFCVALYFGRSFILPVVIALLIALTLGPVVQFGKRLKIPGFISAAVLVVLFCAAVLAGAASLATPFAQLVTDAPRIGSQLKIKLQSLRAPVDSINRMGEEVENIAGNGENTKRQEVVVKGPDLITRAADDVLIIFSTTLLVFILSFFLLISREQFMRKVVHLNPRLSDKKRALDTMKSIERDVSQYLLTVTIINAGLGLIVGFTFYVLEMPNPLLWGVLAALLNFLPYIGAMTGLVVTTGVSLITFDSITAGLVAPAFYLLYTVVEGQFITPLVLGRRFSLNTVVILVAIAFWGFMWGALGVLVAVPLLIVFKVFAERVEGLKIFAELISGHDAMGGKMAENGVNEKEPALIPSGKGASVEPGRRKKRLEQDAA